jgi:hypothetical protein
VILAGLVVVLLGGVAQAGGGWAGTYSLEGGVVALTNAEANASWVPVAVLWRFSVATNAAVTVERVSQGNTYVLGAASVSNVTSAVWVPDAGYPFASGDVLRVGCSVTSGVTQVIRRGE